MYISLLTIEYVHNINESSCGMIGKSGALLTQRKLISVDIFVADIDCELLVVFESAHVFFVNFFSPLFE